MRPGVNAPHSSESLEEDEEEDCEGEDCPEDVECEGEDCPEDEEEDCEGEDCPEEEECEGEDCPADEEEEEVDEPSVSSESLHVGLVGLGLELEPFASSEFDRV